ncbi:MAG: pyruvate formate-lyase activating enzyme, partial [Deltaproteobacteria bacterium]|nr:pyruvate formate-lyase activating enzyme [Deltaproteobacteria bacterium]
RCIIEGMGIPFSFDIVGICAQDHGVPPPGVSHLDYRHRIFKAVLDTAPFPHALMYPREEVPNTLSRLRSIAKAAGDLPAEELFLMDSGMAAILGASLDSALISRERAVVLDIATSHTLGATLERGEIAAFFEYHTHAVTLQRLEVLVRDLAEGRLDHDRILEEGGHGAYIRKTLGFDAIEVIVVTGPRRGLVRHSRLPLVMGAPLGDNMMTGTAGLLEAIRRVKGWDPFSFL